jgi:arginase family enzyme
MNSLPAPEVMASWMATVHFDAHTDYRKQVLGVRFGHGSALRRCSELSCVTNA